MRAGERAYQQLKEEIIQWALRPGTSLGEIETAERIGVSRTPIREALSRLAAEGLVSNGSGRTMVVTPLSMESVKQLYEVREALEMRAARLAARQRDESVFEPLREEFRAGPGPEARTGAANSYYLADKLDLAIDGATDNPYLVGALRDLRAHMARVRRHAQRNPERLVAATDEHLVIVEAILAKDEVLAARATAVHLFKSFTNVVATTRLDVLSSTPMEEVG